MLLEKKNQTITKKGIGRSLKAYFSLSDAIKTIKRNKSVKKKFGGDNGVDSELTENTRGVKSALCFLQYK